MEDGMLPPNYRLEENLFGEMDKKKEGDNELLNFEAYEDMDVSVRGDNAVGPVDSFESCNLGPVIENNIKLMKFKNPTPVQRYSIPILMEGRDIMSCAQTGSGKTAAFLFPIISKLISNKDENQGKLPSRQEAGGRVFPFALVLAPTRELASQIFKDARRFTYRSHLRSVVIYGGSSFMKQTNELNLGCQILIATPGRLIDMIEKDHISLKYVRFLCIDEADRMLDMGFEDQIRKIVFELEMPEKEDRQTLMFSATFPRSIQELARDFLNEYIFIAIGRVGSTTELVSQRIKFIEDDDKKDELLKQLDEIDGKTLIFVATRKSAEYIDDFLYKNNFSCASIHGERTQYERERALESFKAGKIRILVATDVAARGLHIDNVIHVINYDLPSNIDDYVHRIGRTGRCGNLGKATGFFNHNNMNIVRDLVKLLKEANQDIPPWMLEYNREKKNKYGGGGGGGRGGYNRDYRGGTGGYNSANIGRRKNFGNWNDNKDRNGGDTEGYSDTNHNTTTTTGSSTPQVNRYNRYNQSDYQYDD
jgi:ATP-dependent RNA helicase DDX3X